MTLPPLLAHLDLVSQGPGLVVEQTDPTGKKVHTDVQQSVLGLLLPASHCSPASTIPFPHTGLAAPDEKLGGGGTTPEAEAATWGVPVPVAD